MDTYIELNKHEQTIMNIIWKHYKVGEEFTSSLIKEQMSSIIGVTNILSYLGNLERKGFISSKKSLRDCRKNNYTLLVDQMGYARLQSKHILESVHKNNRLSLLASFFYDSPEIIPSLIDELRQVQESLKKEGQGNE